MAGPKATATKEQVEQMMKEIRTKFSAEANKILNKADADISVLAEKYAAEMARRGAEYGFRVTANRWDMQQGGTKRVPWMSFSVKK